MIEPIPPEALLAGYSEPIARLAEALRGVVRATLPAAVERVRPGWRLIGYDLPVGRRMRYFAFVAPEPEHVHLGFEHGILMADPHRQLLGGGITKQVRWLTLRPGDPVDQTVLGDLILEAARVAGLSRAERLARALDREAGPG